MSARSCDLLVIGAGSGGIALAARAAAHGRRCALVEASIIGGTCVNSGCVPKKVMWNGAHLAHMLEDAVDYGFRVGEPILDWKTLVSQRRQYIERLHGVYRRRLERAGVEYLPGRARFTAAKTVEVDGRRYTAEHVVIATGGYPLVPGTEGAELGLTSDDFFKMESCPASIIIAGGGYIAVELAAMLTAFGSAVTLILRGEQPLRGFDSMLREKLAQTLRQQGVRLLPNQRIKSAAAQTAGIEVTTESGETLAAERLLWAIGRLPNTEGLGLDAAGVATDEAGFIKTDAYQNTNVEGVYAVGDVTGRIALTPVAITAGRRLADRLFGGAPERHLSYELIPRVVFTHPPLGAVGLTEAEARARYGDSVKVYNSEFTPMWNAFTRAQPPAAMKLVTQGADERIVGCHIMGPGADEMLQGFAVAIRMGATKRDFDDTVAIHPTVAEELVTMK